MEIFMHDKIVDVLSDAIQDFSQVWDSHEAAENGKSMYASKIIEILEEEFTPKDNWISVENRLPDNNDNVFVYSTHTENENCRIEVGFYNDVYKEWNGFSVYFINKITHWQPLISPPKTK